MATHSVDEPYWLGRASIEQQRLFTQHVNWTKTIGYLLHPSIVKNLPENARIADVGTGTGIWLSDLAKVSPPTYQFAGYDISAEQFIPADNLPANVALELGDFSKPFPAALHGTFDVVNIRLIIISMGVGIWESTLRNVLTLLKPGGAVQWTEGNFFVSRGFRGTSEGSTGGHFLTQGQRQLNNIMQQRFGLQFPDWTRLFTEAGLERVEEDVMSTDRLMDQRRAFTETGIGAVFGGLRNLAALKGEGYWSEEEVDRQKALAIADMETGAYLRWDLQVSVGFKKAAGEA